MIEVNWERKCRSFGHLVRNCRNQEIVGQGRIIEYKDNSNRNHLKEEESLVVLN